VWDVGEAMIALRAQYVKKCPRMQYDFSEVFESIEQA
jgi:hypothetical protein